MHRADSPQRERRVDIEAAADEVVLDQIDEHLVSPRIEQRLRAAFDRFKRRIRGRQQRERWALRVEVRDEAGEGQQPEKRLECAQRVQSIEDVATRGSCRMSGLNAHDSSPGEWEVPLVDSPGHDGWIQWRVDFSARSRPEDYFQSMVRSPLANFVVTTLNL